jgi:hypothetical protein
MSHHEIKRDTAVFSDRQWHVDGYAQHWFSTEQDARSALALAAQIAVNETRELADKIREVLP